MHNNGYTITSTSRIPVVGGDVNLTSFPIAGVHGQITRIFTLVEKENRPFDKTLAKLGNVM